MQVKFQNCDVPIYKLKQGVVVGWECLKHISYGHILSIAVLKSGCVWITVLVANSEETFKSDSLIWLEQ